MSHEFYSEWNLVRSECEYFERQNRVNFFGNFHNVNCEYITGLSLKVKVKVWTLL